jgi:hypothetical protein
VCYPSCPTPEGVFQVCEDGVWSTLDIKGSKGDPGPQGSAGKHGGPGAQGPAGKDGAPSSSAGGEMLKAIYDANSDGVVDNAANLGDIAAASYMKTTDATPSATAEKVVKRDASPAL